MRVTRLLAALALSSSALFSSGVAVAFEKAGEIESEPAVCFILAHSIGDLREGLAVKLCSGTTDGREVFLCYWKAFTPIDEGGLGLSVNFAVNLCKTNSEPF